MRIKHPITALAIGLTLFASGCGITSVVDVTDNPVGHRQGKACVTNLLGLIATGDASISTAARNGGVTKVATVDTVMKGGFFVGSYCTYVTGT